MKAEAIDATSQTFLQQAKAQAEAHNWLEVTYYLQQLPIFTAKKPNRHSLASATEAEIIHLALQVLTQGEFQQKWQVSKLFPAIGKDAIAPLTSLIKSDSEDSETKWFAASILSNFKCEESVIALAALLQTTQDPDLVGIAAKSLAQIGELAIETLIALSNIPDYRAVAAKSLAHIRLSPVLPALIELAVDKDPNIRVLAVEALGSFHSPEVVEVLIQALKDTNSSVRKEAAIALGFCHSLCDTEKLVENLEFLLKDLNLEVCRQAAISLSRMQNKPATLALSRALKSDSISLALKIDLVKALAWSETDIALDHLAVACEKENEIICEEIINVLGRISAPQLKHKAIAILTEYWHSSQDTIDFECKKALATAFGELQAASAKTILQQLSTDENKTIQLYAISSLKKIKD